MKALFKKYHESSFMKEDHFVESSFMKEDHFLIKGKRLFYKGARRKFT